MQDLGNGRMAWVGHAAEDRRNRVILGVSGDAVAGTFAYRGRLYKLEPRANGRHVVSEVEKRDPAPEHDPIPVFDVSGGQSSAPVSGDAGAPGGSEIDVLVAYTPVVEALYGTQGAEALVIQAVAETNQAYTDSQMSTRLNLVHTVRVDYDESGSMSSDLFRLRSSSDGYMDELHTLRDTYGADVVSLIEHEPQYCGVAYRMTSLSTGFASSAFNVVHHSCATGYYSFGHEIGHNQGAHHDHNNAGGAIFPYAYGYQDPNSYFRTIMAYNCPSGCTRVGLFSRGDNTYLNYPAGIPGSAENALAIDETAATVAAFRQASALPPVAPGGLTALPVGTSRVDLDWSDNSGNETEFLVERSDDGVSFVQVASLPTDTESYSDSDLVDETGYSYRVRARNDAGYSGYSNVAVATTESIPEYGDYFAVGETNMAGVVTGSMVDTRLDDGVSESILEELSGEQGYGHLTHNWAFNIPTGEAITLYADVDVDAGEQTFTFAYSTANVSHDSDPGAWVDMFTIGAENGGPQQFTLPASLSGFVFIQVRDNDRVVDVPTSDTVNVDYLGIRVTHPVGEPPGCF
jgi:hypothetical protein